MRDLKSVPVKNDSIFQGGGEMGELLRAYDWNSSPLGDPSTWPQSLKTSVRICLDSRFPIVLWLGKDLRLIYNDAWRPSLGTTKHPWALGRPGQEVWAEIWDTIGPMLNAVLDTGEATWENDQLLLLERHGYIEESYWTYSYSAIRLDDGIVGGVFAAVHETTDIVLGERQLRTLRDLGKSTAQNKTDNEVYRNTIAVLKGNGQDFPFAAIYEINSNKRTAQFKEGTSKDLHDSGFPKELELESNSPLINEMTVTWQTAEIHVLDDVSGFNSEFPTGAWKVQPKRLLFMPINRTGQKSAHAVMVIGMNPYRLYDENYAAFFRLISDQVSASISQVHALEEEKKRAEALAEIDRAKTTFFSNISHELRTPLTLMLSPLEELLSRSETFGVVDRNNLEISHRNTLRLQKLVNTLLEFSRIEAGRVQATFRRVNISALTSDLSSTFRSAIEKAGLQFNVSCEEINEDVYVDVDMWERIVLNLLSNAFKYTEKGRIEVSLLKRDPDFVLEVTDTGIGIPENELQKIFERFHRIQSTGGRSQEGTGIGLSLVQELVKIHKGRIIVESKEGYGSTFKIVIPLGKEHLPKEKLTEDLYVAGKTSNIYSLEAEKWGMGENGQEILDNTTTEIVSERKYSVLLADDNTDMRDYVHRLLRPNYKVTAVNNGRLAFEHAMSNKYDLIISDVMMPEMNGFELVQKLKQNDVTKKIPVILLSAKAGEEATIEGLATGADDYLVKPFVAKELLARVDATIRIAKLRTESERQLYNLLQQAPVAISIIGKEYRLEFMNEASIRITKRDISDIVGKPIFETFPELRNQGYEELLERCFSGETVVLNETSAIVEIEDELKQLYFALTYTPMRNDNGEVDRVMSMGVDITDLIIARNNARENEEYFRRLTDISPVMIWRTDINGSCFYLNKLWYDYTGQTPENALGFGWLDAVHPDDRERSGRIFLDALKAQKHFHINYSLKGADGIYRHFIDYGAPSFSDDGEFEGYIGAVLNIHEQKMAELALEESEISQKLAVEAAGMGTWACDMSTRLVQCSEKTREIFGFNSNVVTLEEVFETIHEDNRELVMNLVNQASEDPAGVYRAEYFVVNKSDNTKRAVVANGKFFFDEESKPVKFIGTCLDVTRHKLIEETLERRVEQRTRELLIANHQLERSNKELEQFAFVTSHDLQEPLRKILTFSQMLSEQEESNFKESSNVYLTKIKDASRRMSNLINDLLDFSRLSKAEEGFEKVDLNKTIMDILTDFEVNIQQKGADINIGNLPTIEGIPLQMNQLFHNLMSNALKFSREGVAPKIDVLCETMLAREKFKYNLNPEKKYYLIRIVDNGIGFKRKYSEKIFEIFQRLNAKSKYEGTGIGLALASRIVANHKGFITASSEEGKRTEFRVVLPEVQG